MKRSTSNSDYLKLLALGDGAVGKTALLIVFTYKKFPKEYIPTALDNTLVEVVCNDAPYKLALWDTAGGVCASHNSIIGSFNPVLMFAV